MNHLTLLLGILYIALCATQFTQAQQVSSICNRGTNCINCMEAHPTCRWCIAKKNDSVPNWDPAEGRCDVFDSLLDRGCPFDKIKGDIQSIVTGEINVEPRDASADGKEEAVQLSPQKLSITLRPNERFTRSIKFRLAKDYPVDLYYLMDLSQSMADDKTKVADLGISLATEMKKITQDVRLGFGSFVDKVLMPYVNTVPYLLKNPCTDCESPYSFKHRLSLTEDTDRFGYEVNKTRTSGNLDTPEGGFDAMMQAIVCDEVVGWRNYSRKLLIFSTDSNSHLAGEGKKTIGWRNQSRKMLIYSSDAPFHTAGDGKLGGVIEPNDGLCHMQQNEYTWASKQDYPSISQIASKVAEERVNIIFAVIKSQTERYKRLSSIIPGSVTGELAADSGNVVELVRENYEKISSVVTMTKRRRDVRNEDLEIAITSDCGSGAPSATCSTLRPGQLVNFNVTMLAKTCSSDVKSETFEIYPIGLGESLEITVKVACDCDCNDTERNSDACSGVGTYECGICDCTGGQHYGDECQCNKTSVASDRTDLDATCIPPDNSSLTLKPCTERGTCVCGKCEECDCLPGNDDKKTCKRFKGKYCQCNSNHCPRNQDGVCSNRGKCECIPEQDLHYCDCDPGYEGFDCSYTKETCIDPKDETRAYCRGRGECKLGVCDCNVLTDGERYTGPYCEECATCTQKCPEFKSCVYCRIPEVSWTGGAYTEEECNTTCYKDTKNTKITYAFMEALPEVAELKVCNPITLADDCKIKYGYKHTPKKGFTIYVIEKECPTVVNLLIVIPAVVGSIVLVGIIALLIWKLVTTIHDRREFAKFEQERQNAKWESGENPIYAKAIKTFKNPMYEKSGL